MSAFAEDTDRAKQFLELAKKYTDFSELTTPMINEFVEKIIVHAPEKLTATGCRKWISTFALSGSLSFPHRS